MIELKRFNVHKIVDSKEKAEKLISLGFSVLEDEKEDRFVEKEKVKGKRSLEK